MSLTQVVYYYLSLSFNHEQVELRWGCFYFIFFGRNCVSLCSTSVVLLRVMKVDIPRGFQIKRKWLRKLTILFFCLQNVCLLKETEGKLKQALCHLCIYEMAKSWKTKIFYLFGLQKQMRLSLQGIRLTHPLCIRCFWMINWPCTYILNIAYLI